MGQILKETRIGDVAYVTITKTRELSHGAIGEFDSRDFHTDEVWKKWKTDLDGLLAFKKTIKQKPDEYQRIILDINQSWIEYYNSVLFHSPRLAKTNRCDCHSCGKKRTDKNTTI